MTYVFDTSPFVALFRYYYRSRFPSLWEHFDEMIESEKIISTREVFREIEDRDDDLLAWAKNHREVFTTPIADEGAFVAKIYNVSHFQANIEQQKILQGGKNADPFVIAKAAVSQASVVTLESLKPNAAKIPNICRHFHIPCLTLEEFMTAENWQF